jgi:hypothetical protein
MPISTDYTGCTGCCPGTTCCPGVTVPSILHATLSDGPGNCACVSGSITLTWDPATSKWTGTGPFGSCGRNITISVYCVFVVLTGYVWEYDMSFSDACLPAITGQQFLTVVCSPLSLSVQRTVHQANVCGCTGVSLNSFNMVVTV